jgi:hypothetical protein
MDDFDMTQIPALQSASGIHWSSEFPARFCTSCWVRLTWLRSKSHRW